MMLWSRDLRAIASTLEEIKSRFQENANAGVVAQLLKTQEKAPNSAAGLESIVVTSTNPSMAQVNYCFKDDATLTNLLSSYPFYK
jgi:hypothetical protein